MGYSLPMIGRALNHTQAAATTERDAHLQLDVVRAALESTAQLIVAAVAPAEDKGIAGIEEAKRAGTGG